MGRCREIVTAFRALATVARPVQRVAVVGEIYTKYCRLGNWDLMSFLASEFCEVGVGGVTWYALYYMDSHSLKGSVVSRRLYRLLAGYLAGVQREMLAILREAGFRTLPPLAECKRQAVGYAPLDLRVADGWLIAAEAVAWAPWDTGRFSASSPSPACRGTCWARGSMPRCSASFPASAWSAWTMTPPLARARSKAGFGCCWMNPWRRRHEKDAADSRPVRPPLALAAVGLYV